MNTKIILKKWAALKHSMGMCSAGDTYSFLSGKKPQALVQWGAGFTGGFADLLQLLNNCRRQSCKNIKKHRGFKNTDVHMQFRPIKCSGWFKLLRSTRPSSFTMDRRTNISISSLWWHNSARCQTKEEQDNKKK